MKDVEREVFFKKNTLCVCVRVLVCVDFEREFNCGYAARCKYMP